ncbi:hypothetical protein B0O99DRAFT_700663 [Bisporella sp. PMI_857]|nr:hypothetical protein B0O99DRAFT_700663 [Bisporella sp. PMI_857]
MAASASPSDSQEPIDEDKWQYGIDAKKATTEDLNSYVNARVREYTRHTKLDFDLWELFQDDFQSFDKEEFNKITLSNRQILRSYLHTGGVYIPPRTKSKTLG